MTLWGTSAARYAPPWVRDLLQHRALLEERLGAPLDKLLGCGFYGCVFSSEPPWWVVKFTIDELEGPTWAKLGQLQRDECGKYPAILRTRDVLQITPGVTYEGDELALYAIVREAAQTTGAEYLNDLRGQLRDAVQRLMCYSYRRSATGEDRARALDYLEAIVLPEARDVRVTLTNLLLDQRMIIGDLGPENVGWRAYDVLPDHPDYGCGPLEIGQLVLLDLGRTESPLPRPAIGRVMRENLRWLP